MKYVIALCALLVALPTWAATMWAAAYGVEETFGFEIWSTDGLSLDVDESDAGTEVTLMCDEAAPATATNDYVDEGNSYSITLTAAEMQCEYITVWVDGAVDTIFYVQTYGHASAMVASFAQTGDSFARIGANGGGLTALATQASVDAVDDLLDTEFPALVTAVDNVDNFVDTEITALMNARTQLFPGADADSVLTADSGDTNTLVDAELTFSAAQDIDGAYVVRSDGQRCFIDSFTPGTDTIEFLCTFTGAWSTQTYKIYPANEQ
jgi:hypothetical protein